MKYKCNLNTMILILMVFWASFHLLHFCFLNRPPKSTIIIIKINKSKKKKKNTFPSPKVALPQLSTNLSVCIGIPQSAMKQEEHCFIFLEGLFSCIV